MNRRSLRPPHGSSRTTPHARAGALPLRTAAAGVALLAAATGCGVLSSDGNPVTTDDITVTSTMIREGEAIPARFTCKGDGISPPLRWSGLPPETKSLALVVDDPEAVGGAAVYWVLYGLDPQNPEIPEGSVPQGARQGRNSADRAEYDAPCPSGDAEHEFRFTVYALKGKPELGDSAPLDEALGAIAAHTLSRGRLIATGGQ